MDLKARASGASGTEGDQDEWEDVPFNTPSDAESDSPNDSESGMSNDRSGDEDSEEQPDGDSDDALGPEDGMVVDELDELGLTPQ